MEAIEKENYFEKHKKASNLRAQITFRKKHPFYNSWQSFKKRAKKKGLPYPTYEEWCADKIQQKEKRTFGSSQAVLASGQMFANANERNQ